ncbi:MAG: bestrophin family protein [Bacteroidia bacterium]
MVNYNPKDWFKLIFSVQKSDTIRMLAPAIIGIATFTFFVCFIEIHVLELKYKSTTLVHSLLGFVISMLLVFRTNTAYERWWEGRKLWGAMVNNSRNLAIKLNTYIPKGDSETRERFRILLTNYVFAVKEHLRTGVKTEQLEETSALPFADFKKVNHVPNHIASVIFNELNQLVEKKIINDEKMIVLNAEFSSLTDITGGCERIKNTPIPYSYSMFLKKFIFIYVITMPFGFVTDFKYWTVPVVIFVFYVLASLELIAEEIEDPFGKDANDLPTDDIAGRIKNNLREIFSLSSRP